MINIAMNVSYTAESGAISTLLLLRKFDIDIRCCGFAVLFLAQFELFLALLNENVIHIGT
jgi:hypothetical protein